MIIQSNLPPPGVPERICEIAREAAARTAYGTRSYMDHVDIIAAAVMKGLEGQAPAAQVSALPMLFQGPMVRALLGGHKTQTRRLLSRARTFATPDSRPLTLRGRELARALLDASDFRCLGGDSWTWEAFAFKHQAPATRTRWNAHIGFSAGDRIWVRESWHAARSLDRTPPRDIPRDADIEHAATARSYAEIGLKGKLRPAMFMPRWASRLTLTVTEVRVQRLHDITEADAEAEGVCAFAESLDKTPWGSIAPADRLALVRGTYGSAVNAYRHLWELINGPDAWAENPWVVAFTFTVRHGNIDEVPHG